MGFKNPLSCTNPLVFFFCFPSLPHTHAQRRTHPCSLHASPILTNAPHISAHSHSPHMHTHRWENIRVSALKNTAMQLRRGDESQRRARNNKSRVISIHCRLSMGHGIWLENIKAKKKTWSSLTIHFYQSYFDVAQTSESTARRLVLLQS